MVDISKIQVGDEIAVRCTVAEIREGGIYTKTRWRDGSPSHQVMHTPVDRIVSHTPKPREIKVGDEVAYEHFWGVVRHIDGDFAWVRAPAEQRGVVKLKAELTHKS